MKVEDIPEAEKKVRKAVTEGLSEICTKIEDGEELSDDDQAAIVETARSAIEKEVEEQSEDKNETEDRPDQQAESEQEQEA